MSRIPAHIVGILATLISINLLPSVCAQGLSLKDMLGSGNGQIQSQNQLPRQLPAETQWIDRSQQFSEQVAPDPRFNAEVSSLIAKNVLELAHGIGKTVLADSQEKSEVFSPLSIYGALSLLLLGATGQTFDELMQLMRFSGDPFVSKNPWKIHEEFGLLIDDVTKDKINPQHQRPQHNWKFSGENSGRNNYQGNGNTVEHKITVANGLFVQNGFSIRPEYRSAVLGIYQSNIRNLDFSEDMEGSTKYINDWVNQKTEGKIPEMVRSLSRDTKIVLASALYFNAMWEKTFFESGTSLKNFYPDGLGQTSVRVEMMGTGGSFPYYDAKEFDCRIIGLPYKESLTTMYVIVPNNSNRLRLRQMQEYLTPEKIDDMISKMEWKTAIVLLPKMHFTNQIDLRRVLQKMGLNSIFDRSISDLSLISNGQDAGSSYQPPFQAVQQFPSLQPASAPLAPFPMLDNSYKFQMASLTDDSNDAPFIFSRHGEDDEEDDNPQTTTDATSPVTEKSSTEAKTDKPARHRRDVSYKVPSATRKNEPTLRLKDYIISKRITKSNPGKKHIRSKRQIDLSESVKQLDQLRSQLSQGYSSNPGLFADDILHKVDLTVNEKGTAGGAATVTLLKRTGTDAVVRVETPFMFMIRHDDTKLPLFYGAVYEPTDY